MWDQRGSDQEKRANMGRDCLRMRLVLDAGGGRRKGFWVWKEVLEEMKALSRNWEEKIRNGVELHVGEINYVT
jgi:hypothetical protein